MVASSSSSSSSSLLSSSSSSLSSGRVASTLLLRALACLCLTSPSVVSQYNYTSTWVSTSSLGSGQQALSAGGNVYLCRVTYLNLLGGRPISYPTGSTASCTYVTALGGAGTTSYAYTVMVADASLSWGPTVPSGGVTVTAGAAPSAGVSPLAICRASNVAGVAAAPLPNGPYAGWVNATTRSCMVLVGGGVVGVAAPAFDYLFSAPAGVPLPPGSVPAMTTPSASPSRAPSRTPSPTPQVYGTATFLNYSVAVAAGYSVSNLQLSGTEGLSSIYVCHGTLPDGDVVVGKFETSWMGCDVPWQGQEITDVLYQVLLSAPWLAWSGYPIPADGTIPVIAGVLRGALVQPCRAYHPTARTGPHSGYTTYANMVAPTSADPTFACVFSWGGNTVLAVTPFQVLVTLSPALTAQGLDATGAWVGSPALVYATATSSPAPPTATATPSASLPPPIPGVIQWWNISAATPASMNVIAGYENGAPVYVCRGYAPDGALLPGKYEAGWGGCDIAAFNRELSVSSFNVLRKNPLLAWNATIPPGGVAVVAGRALNAPLTVCRAWHPTVPNSGPHPGFSDGFLYGGVPICFFSWGGGVYRVATFDYLYMVSPPSASPSPVTQTPTSSLGSTPAATRSGTTTASPTITASGTASGAVTTTPSPQYFTATPSASAAVAQGAPTPSLTPSGTASPTTTPPDAGGNINGISQSPAPPPTPSPSHSPMVLLNSADANGYTATVVMAILVIILAVAAAWYYRKLKKQDDFDAKNKKKAPPKKTATAADAEDGGHGGAADADGFSPSSKSSSSASKESEAPAFVPGLAGASDSLDDWNATDPAFKYVTGHKTATGAHV